MVFKDNLMELGFADSLEFICFDYCPMSCLAISEQEISNPNPQQKHVTFAPSPIVINFPIQELSNPFSMPDAQPISILKKTNYKYSPLNQWLRKLSDLFCIILIISFLTFFDKIFKLYS